LRHRSYRDHESRTSAPVIAQNDENIKDPEGRCRKGKEVDRHYVLRVVLKKCPPALRRRFPMTHHVL
ncbi:MAG: hypothetical protein KJ831_10035, partial [Candidatus Eisenbacteria bacterium]|nr:hypothetical protein [Candidatus Eisenbacteria bacterium]